MKRLLLATVVAALLSAPALAQGASSLTRITQIYGATATGTTVAEGTTTKLLLDVDNPNLFPAAASLKVTPTTGGSIAKGSIYDESGALRVRIVLQQAAPATDGSSAITGTGKITSGTGSYVKARGSFKVTGTRSATGVYSLKLKGHIAYDVRIPIVGSGRGQ